MKNLSYFALVLVALMSLSACSTRGNVDTAAPYEMERTAEHSDGVTYKVRKEEKMVCPPQQQCPACTADDNLKARIAMLENQLNECREKMMRMQESTREMMTK